MREQDTEIEWLKDSVNCAVLLERLPPVWRLDGAESTRHSLKYRRGPGEILIVNHDGRGWWDPLSESKGDIFTLAQHLDPGLNFGAARRVLRGFAGVAPSFPENLRARQTATSHVSVTQLWERRRPLSRGSLVWRYLTGPRGLPDRILGTADAADAVREGPQGSAWFAHRDGAGVLTGIEMRGPAWRTFSAGGSKTLFRLPGEGKDIPMSTTSRTTSRHMNRGGQTGQAETVRDGVTADTLAGAARATPHMARLRNRCLFVLERPILTHQPPTSLQATDRENGMGRFGRHRCRAPSVDGECDVITARQYGLNVYAAVNRRMPEACALLSWLASNAQELGIENFEIPDDGPLEPRHQVTAAAWEKAAHYLSTATGEFTDDVPDAVGHWVDYVGRGVGLDRLEGEILKLCINYTVDGRVEELFDGMRGARNRSPCLTADSRVISVMLGAAREQTQQRLQPEARLQASGLLLVKCASEILVLGRLMRLIHRGLPDGRDLQEQLLGGTPPPSLPWEAFGHLGPEAELAANVLSRAVAEREPGISILLYGPPGTGKTTFAAALAARAGVKLRPVGEADDTGDEPNRGERLFDLRLAHRLVAPGSAVLLFDEAEDLFGGWVLDGMPVRGSRVFTHRLLEQTAVPVIWTANDIRQISPAALRRMTLCLELRLPTLANRARLWRSMAGEAGVALTETEAATLARLIPTAPAVASSALRAARLAGGGAGAARLAVEGLARAVNGGRLPVPEPPMEEFDFALVNADADLEALTGRLVRPGAPRAVSLLLSGPPGSGKSAFVRQLATRMGLPLVQKRASDLLDMYVGGTEKAIAAAFAEARDNNAFLVFDEADSLLLDRADAVRSWEVTQVNEMLTWMESHTLPFTCTTNLPDRLDSASLRRFLVKVRFDWLRPGQARHAFATHFHCTPPQELDALGTLTPADFALVQRRAALAGAEGDPAALLRLLRQECESRVGGRQPIGFGRVGGP